MKTIWRVSSYLFRYKGLFWLTLGLAAAMVVTGIGVPIAIKEIVEVLEARLTGTQTEADGAMMTLLGGVGVILLLYLGEQVFNSLRIRVNNTLEQRVLLDMRGDLHNKLLNLPISFYDKRKSGEISSRVIEDVANVERALLDGTEQGSRALLMVVGVTAVLFWMNPLLAAFVVLPVPVLLVMGFFYAKGSRKIWKGVREAAADLNSLLVEDIQGNRLIQTFGLQEREGGRFRERALRLRERTLRGMFRWSVYHPSTTFITNLGVVSILGIGGYMILSGTEGFSFGELVAFFFLAMMLYQPIGMLHQLNHLLAQGKASGDRIFEILDHEFAVQSPPEPKSFPPGMVELRFDGVTFGYGERGEVLRHFDLTVEAGKVTALVGHTGAGKSTVANLAMRAYDVTGGAVRVNGTDIRGFSLEDVHQKIGHVAQDPFLFEGTVEENLRLARPDAGAEALVNALRGASAWDFVRQLPDGMQTNIGEKGIRLSQGEKQRLTIARVLLKNPPFIILDEATASVDTITERRIQDALENLMKDRTVLVIAHRLSTVAKADKIVVMEHGRIIEEGPHSVLADGGGHYARLWQHQIDLIPEAVE